MKLFCGIFVIFVVILAVTANNSPQEYEKFAETCQKEAEASEEDVDDMLNGALPTTKALKCLYACFYSKMGLVDKTNKLVPEVMNQAFNDISADESDDKFESIKKIIKDLAVKCNSVTVPDKCESIAKLLDCVRVEIDKHFSKASGT